MGDYGGVEKKMVGLKMYLNQTHRPLLLFEPEEIKVQLHVWPREKPILVHADDKTGTQKY